MKWQGKQFTALIAIGCCIGQVAAQQVVQVLHNVHVAGKIALGGTATGSDGKEHLLVGVKLATPLEGGIDRVEAVVTRNEPSEKIRTSIGLYSGGVKNAGSVDLTCASVKVLATSAHKMALGEDCTFNRYDGPIAPE